MKNSDAVKLLSWVIIFGLFLWMYDQSSKVFSSSVNNLFELNFTVLAVMNVIFWLIGFFGLIAFSQVQSKAGRIIFWAMFALVYTINFLYNFHDQSLLSQANSGDLVSLFTMKNDIANISYIKYFGSVSFVLAFAYFTKPLGINLHKYFIVGLLISAVAIIALFSNLETVPMQKIFILPLIVSYCFLLKVVAFAKANIF